MILYVVLHLSFFVAIPDGFWSTGCRDFQPQAFWLKVLNIGVVRKWPSQAFMTSQANNVNIYPKKYWGSIGGENYQILAMVCPKKVKVHLPSRMINRFFQKQKDTKRHLPKALSKIFKIHVFHCVSLSKSKSIACFVLVAHNGLLCIMCIK